MGESMNVKIVGIDLGTTNSAMADISQDGLRLWPDPAGNPLVPSVVWLDPDGTVVVGSDARSALVAMPARTVAAIKRKMGSAERVVLGGREFSPEEISAMILRELRQRVSPGETTDPIEAVITVPAYFNEAQRRATKEAGELAGFVVERIINEPTAAALAFGFYHVQEERTLLVYDLGGGTFDVSVIRLSDGVLEVRASTGDRHLGGEDFDWLLVDWLAAQVEKANGVNPLSDLRARARLKEAAEHMKWQLSEEEHASVSIPVLLTHQGKPISLDARLSRRTFEGMIAHSIDRTMALIEEVLQAAEIRPSDVDDVLLVGGSTRIPLVGRRIADRFGKLPRTDVDPDLAVALGAAVQAGLKAGLIDPQGLIATDVAPFSMGIAVAQPDWMGNLQPGFFHPLIRKNTPIPASASDKFSTVSDGQQEILVEVFQGEGATVFENHALGSFRVTGLPASPAGREAIEVKFRYNLNGMLDVSARSLSTGRSIGMSVQDALDRQSQEHLEASKRRLEALWTGSEEAFADSDAERGPDVRMAPPATDDWDEAVAEAKRLTTQLESCSNQARVRSALENLARAEAAHEVSRLLNAIDAALDVLIDLDDEGGI